MTPRNQEIGPYRIEEILGSGGMSIVYRAIAPDGSRVALKVMSHPSEALLQRFTREANIRIDHPNVVRTIEAQIDRRGTPWIAFELLEGTPLDRELAKGPMETAAVHDLGLQACAGLSAAHAEGVIHRDLKPANVFKTTGGVIKLLDFGIAHLLIDERLTATGMILGTPEYLAPEQARGDQSVDERTDIWGLGAVLYHALTGQPPFRRDSPLATLVAVAMEPVRPLIDVAPHVPSGLARVVQRALSRSKDRRFHSVHELESALRSLDAPVDPDGAAEPFTHIFSGEQKIVALLLAEGVKNRARFEERVRFFGGQPVPLIGARSIALFGGEAWTGDEVERAARAAIAVREDAVRVAIASGRAAETRGRLTGGALAAAETCAKETMDGVALDVEAARSLLGVFSVVEVKPGIFELTAGPARPRPPRTALIGREVEMAALDREVVRAIETSRALVLSISGPPGIGKTRLVETFAEDLQKDLEYVVLRGRGRPHEKDHALAILSGMLLSRAEKNLSEGGAPRIGKEGSPAERQHALHRLVREAVDDDGLHSCAEFLAEALGIDMPASAAVAAARQDAQLMKDRIRVAFRDWFEGLARRSVVVFVLEDLQWADAESLALLAEIFHRVEDRPSLLLTTSRTDSTEQLRDRFPPPSLRIELAGLLSKDVSLLARSVAGHPLPDGAVKHLTERTSGNPLFVEHLVRAWVERGDEDLSAIPIPLSVEAAIQARVDALPASEKEALKCAAIFDRAFSERELDALDVDRDILVSLVRRGLFGRVRENYAFKSSMVAAVALRMMSEESRRSLHARTAKLLEAAKHDAPEEIAQHAELGGDKASAASWYAAAAFDHARRADSLGVVRCAERALELDVRENEFALRMALADALQFLGRHEEQHFALAGAIDAASDDRERARVLSEEVKWLRRRGMQKEALQFALSSVEVARRTQDALTIALALGPLGLLLAWNGRLEDAQAVLNDSRAIAADAPAHVRGLIAGWHGQMATQLGHQEKRRDEFRRAAELYAEAGDLRRAAGARVNLADVLNRLGAYVEAEVALRESLEDCRRVGNRPMEGYALANLGYALDMQGRSKEALAILDHARAISAAIADSRLATSIASYVAKARLALLPEGSPEIAAMAERTAATAREGGQPGRAVFAMTIAARASLALKDVESALAWSQRALALRDELGSVEEDEADVFLVRAASLDAAGLAHEAGLVRARGAARVLEVARSISDEELRSRFLADVPAHRALT